MGDSEEARMIRELTKGERELRRRAFAVHVIFPDLSPVRCVIRARGTLEKEWRKRREATRTGAEPEAHPMSEERHTVLCRGFTHDPGCYLQEKTVTVLSYTGRPGTVKRTTTVCGQWVCDKSLVWGIGEYPEPTYDWKQVTASGLGIKEASV